MTTNGTEERPLPDGWTWTTIGEVARTTSGGTPSRKRPEYYGGTIPWVKSGELGDSIVNAVSETITDEGLKNSSAKIFPKGTALVALYGATVGKIGILGIDAATNQAVCAIFPEDGLFTAKFMTYWLRSQRDTLIGLSSGGAQPNISQTIVKAFHFPLAPLPEQERIVAEIEKQFTRLDQAVASLRRLQSNLARYKASVLKAACDGRLVPQDPNDEPAADLLARILAERRAQWQAANPGKKYQEPVGVEGETAVLPNLSDGWVWARAEQVCDPIANGTTPRGRRITQDPTGIPFIKVSNLTFDGSLDFEKKATYFEHADYKDSTNRSKVRPGDVLINIVGLPFGQASIVPETYSEWIINQNITVFRPITNDLNSKFLSYVFLAPSYTQRDLVNRATATAGQYYINLTTCRSGVIPLPPLAEQERIVAEVERRLSVVTAIEQTITTNLSRAERLRQAILHRAFTGRLV